MSDSPRAEAGTRRVCELRGVTVRFGARPVLDEVELACTAGTVLELRGRNGSGKTTLLRVLAGVRHPTVGRRTGPRHVAFVPAAVEPPAIAVASWLAAVRPRGRSVAPALATLGFTGSLDAPCRSLSYGNLRKVLLADAFTADADLVLVDEAREGLDGPGLDGLAVLVHEATLRAAAVVLADQAAHPALPGAEVLVVDAGRVLAAGPSLGTVDVALRGPAAAAPELRDAARRLGFAELARPDGPTGSADDAPRPAGSGDDRPGDHRSGVRSGPVGDGSRDASVGDWSDGDGPARDRPDG